MVASAEGEGFAHPGRWQFAEPAAGISHPCSPGHYDPEVEERVAHTFFVCKLT